MCDPSTILELNTTGIINLRDGKRQEAMDSFQASMSNLLNYITLETERKVKMEGETQQMVPSCSTSLRKRKRTSGEPESPSMHVNDNRLAPLPLLEQPQQQHQHQPPFTLTIPLETPTSDTFPEHATTLFNQVLVLPKEYGLLRDNYDMIYASLLYNMGLVLHNYGLQYSCGKSLRKALETYEVAHGVLVHDLQRKDDCNSRNSNGNGNGNGKDIHHWLLYALFNNMANIYNFARSPIMTHYCLERLRLVLSYSDSSLLETNDLLFYVVNLDVLGGPGIISAAAA